MCIEINYIKIVSSLLEKMTPKEFTIWKNIDKWGNNTNETKYKEDLRRELESIERYDLLMLI